MKILLSFLFATTVVGCNPETFVNEPPTNHFQADNDCNLALQEGDTCVITYQLDYSGGRVTCTNGTFVVVVASGSKTHPFPDCTPSDTAAMTAQCNCASGVTSGDAVVGEFCIDKTGVATVFAACAAGAPFSAECACGSSDNSVGTIVGYAAGITCTQDGTAGAAGAFGYPSSKTPSSSPSPSEDYSTNTTGNDGCTNKNQGDNCTDIMGPGTCTLDHATTASLSCIVMDLLTIADAKKRRFQTKFTTKKLLMGENHASSHAALLCPIDNVIALDFRVFTSYSAGMSRFDGSVFSSMDIFIRFMDEQLGENITASKNIDMSGWIESSSEGEMNCTKKAPTTYLISVVFLVTVLVVAAALVLIREHPLFVSSFMVSSRLNHSVAFRFDVDSAVYVIELSTKLTMLVQFMTELLSLRSFLPFDKAPFNIR